MKAVVMTALLLALVPATGGASAATIAYGSIDIVEGSEIEQRYSHAKEDCMVEASTPPRGHPFAENFYNQAALRACLYRKGFSSKGEYVYPVPLFGSPSSYYKVR